jgi:phage shock protein PspC (stress-responsive transcriptional regulator)
VPSRSESGPTGSSDGPVAAPTRATRSAELPAAVLPPVDGPAARRPLLLTARDGALFAGLVSGVARFLGIDAGLLRVPLGLLFLIGLVLWWPLALALGVLYLALWLAIPQEDALRDQ